MKLIEAVAHCHGPNCEWETYGLNSMGNAAQHHYKTGHSVYVDLIYIHAFKGESRFDEKEEGK